MSIRILVVDDEPDIRFLLKDILEDEGYLVDVAEHAQAANEKRSENNPDLVLLDIWMPEVDGVTLLKEWKSSKTDICPVVMMSGHGTVETAVEATKFGAYDFVEKPLSMAKLLNTVKAALASAAVSTEKVRQSNKEEPVGNSEIVQRLKRSMQLISRSSHPVFFSGATGSGRKIWASYLCELSGSSFQCFDPSKDFNQYLPLTKSIYIEEVSDLSLDVQSDLLQAISDARDSKHRCIVASRSSYSELVENPIILPEIAAHWHDAIYIPSLYEHIEDIPELLDYYVNWYSDHEQLPYRHFGVAAQNLLRNYEWLGDILQLKQFIQKILSNSNNKIIELEEIELVLKQSEYLVMPNKANLMQLTINLDMDLREAREVFEREYLSRHLEICGNNMTELARRVGQERTNLYRKLKSLGLHNKK
ncbi:MAG: two-component system nitrogen regulation response regulator NtrX [Candidatus Azotimanducaceae bacterium]|jgi:two-component system nitrogen regulation response regulator NtrX